MFFFVAFAGGSRAWTPYPASTAGGYTTFVYGFVLLQASAFGGVFTGFAVARDFESGFSRRVMLAAQKREGIVAGYWLAALVRAVFTIAVITGIALLSGLEINGGLVDIVGLYTLALLGQRCGDAVRHRRGHAAAHDAGRAAHPELAFLILFLAPVWVPYDLLTGWVKAAASVNPITLVIESIRASWTAIPPRCCPPSSWRCCWCRSRFCGPAAGCAAPSALPAITSAHDQTGA